MKPWVGAFVAILVAVAALAALVVVITGWRTGAGPVASAAEDVTSGAPVASSPVATESPTTSVPATVGAAESEVAATAESYGAQRGDWGAAYYLPISDKTTSDGAYGSGCAPNSDWLPDGLWFGWIEGWTGTWLEFDLACWHSEDSDFAEDYFKDNPRDEPYWLVKNDNPKLRDVAVAADAVFLPMDCDGLELPEPVWMLDELPFDYSPYVWIKIEDGELVIAAAACPY